MSSRKKYRYKSVQNHEIPIIIVDSPPMDHQNHQDQNQNEKSNSKNDKEDDEEANVGTRRLSLRRNSISLPNLDELQVFKEQVQQIENRGGRPEESDSDEEIPTFRASRNARRKSVTSPRMLKPPGDDDLDNYSPANSVTSVNSLASLLREKLQAFPTTLRKQKTPDYKTRIFVFLLFCTIVVLICTAYGLYHQKISQKAYFEKLKFNKLTRIMKIHNTAGVEVIRARLGTTINYDRVLNCLPKDERHDGSICSEWMNRVRLYLTHNQINSELKCYNFHWIALKDTVFPTDCFDLSLPNDHWYGGGQPLENAFPLEKCSHDFAPFITGNTRNYNEWGNVLRRYFITARGASLIVDEKTPLHVSIKNQELCLMAKFDDFAYVNLEYHRAELNYTLCVDHNMMLLHANLTDNKPWKNVKVEDFELVKKLLTEPVWDVAPKEQDEITEELLSNYTDHIDNLRILKHGHVLINEFWQKNIGDFQVDLDRFPTLDETIERMHRHGFRVVFTIHPFISTESANFAEAVSLNLLVTERRKDRKSDRNTVRRIPALTRYKSVRTAGVLDITNNATLPWLLSKLQSFMATYKLDAFYLDLGTGFDIPHYYEFAETFLNPGKLMNPDEFKTKFVETLQKEIDIFAVNSAVQRPSGTVFVSLPTFESSWDGIRRIIPTMLTYGILGYPFLIPGAVGGDYESLEPPDFNATLLDSQIDKELYIRWLQLSTFLPVVKLRHIPSSFADETIDKLVVTLANLRETKLNGLFQKYAKEAIKTGLPIVRPLWMLDFDDASCHSVEDEFAIGNSVIVAPILHAGALEREIYLPAGVWKDANKNATLKGNRWIHDYKVDEISIPYFEKMPDNTRF